MIVYLVRHTPVDAPTGVIYGQTDVPVNTMYDALMPIIRRKLPAREITACYSSPSSRCVNLARDICPLLDVKTDPRLMELDFGDWELKTWQTIDQVQAKHWGDHFVDTPCPGGESFQQLHERVSSFWRELHKLPEDAIILIVTHAGVIRSIVSDITGKPLDAIFDIKVDLGGITKLAVTRGYDQLEFTNQ